MRELINKEVASVSNVVRKMHSGNKSGGGCHVRNINQIAFYCISLSERHLNEDAVMGTIVSDTLLKFY